MRGARGEAADAGAAPWRPGPRGTETRRGRLGARAWAAGPSRGIAPAAQARFVQLPWKPAGSRGLARPWGGGTRRRATRARVAQPSHSRGSLRPPPPATLGPLILQPRGPRGFIFLVVLLEAGLMSRAPRGSSAQGSAPPSGLGAAPPHPAHSLSWFSCSHSSAFPTRVPAESIVSQLFLYHFQPGLQTPHLRKQMLSWSSWGPRGRDWLLCHQGAGRWGPGSRRARGLRPQHPAKCLVNLNCRKEFSKSPVITGVSG